MKNIIDFILRRYKLVLIVVLLVTLPLTYFYTKQEFNNNVDIFFDRDDQDMQDYMSFREMYGNEELALIIFKDDNIFSNKNLEIIRKISKRLKKTSGVQRIFSITEQEEAVVIDDTITFKKIIPEGNLNEQDLKAVREKTVNNNVLKQRLISEDGLTTGIMIELKPVKESMQKVKLVEVIRETTTSIAGDKIELHFSGGPFFEAELNKVAKNDMLRLIPICTIVIFGIVMLMLKNMRLSLLCITNILLISIMTVGTYVLCGEYVNMVTTMLPAILMAISVAGSIHLLAHYRDEYAKNGQDHVSAVSKAVNAVWFPCLFTSLTTAVGFFSFITSNLRPSKMFGIFTAGGVMIALIMTVTFLPAILIFFRKSFKKAKPQESIKTSIPSEEQDNSRFTGVLIRIGNFTIAHSKAICVAFIFVIIFTVIGIYSIRYETNIVSFLPDDNVIKSDLQFVEENLGGTFTSEYLIQANSEEFDFNQPASLKMLSEIQDHSMADFNHISSTLTIADYQKEMNRAFQDGKDEHYRVPENRVDIMDYYELGDPDDLKRLVSSDRMEARVSFQNRIRSNTEVKKAIIKTDNYLQEKLGSSYSFKKTGINILYFYVWENLKNTLLKSFLFAFVIIFLMMFYVCKNIKLTAISMVANLLPIFLTFGVMGILNIPIDTITMMIASITLGIAVDDTIHFIVWFERNASSGMDTRSALIETYRKIGKPIVITSIVLFLGFLTLVIGSMMPMKVFGIFTAFSILTAVVSDLVLLPALILVFRPSFESRSRSIVIMLEERISGIIFGSINRLLPSEND